MAYKDPPKEFRWKKGVSANPGGRHKNKELEAVKRTTYEDFIDNLQRYGKMTMPQLAIEKERKDLAAFNVMFANTVYAAAKGSKDAINILLDRLWGKPKEVESLPFAAEQEMLKQIPMHELIALARKYMGPESNRATEVIDAVEVKNDSPN